jgi:ribosome-associated heat shock protein Hsp15
MTDECVSTERIDKWLWFVRFFKTRVLATAAVQGGHVKVAGERVRPGYRVSAGAIVEMTRDQLPYLLTVTSIPARRGPAAEARNCYTESEESVRIRQDIANSIRRDRLQMPRTDGRPDKHTQRKLRDRSRRSDQE